ncbi:MAG TPA: alpha-hydroxy acid oxidase [Vicinamibacterales bacterium]|nr:alpha-hydroxy acid oxidase [Vicinamibacterales bacterium]
MAFVAASPLLVAAGVERTTLTRWLGGSRRENSAALALIDQAAQDAALIASPSEALNVFDFELVARKNIPVAHWGYLMTGSDDDGTIRANRDGFNRYGLRVRRLVDVSRIDPSIRMLDVNWDTPIVLCPVGSQKAFHREGEIAVARAAKAKGHLQVLSTVTTSSVEDVSAARGGPVWYQLYHQTDWNQTRQIIKRAEQAGCPAIVFTVDLLGGSNRETMLRAEQADSRDCSACHKGGKPAPGLSGLVGNADNRRKPMIAEFAPATPIPEAGTPTWEFVKRLKDATSMKVIIKGIVTREDAELAVEHGVNGLFVSNHGGRAENSQRATIECLPEVAAGVRGRVPIVLDGGVRRGTDIFKALALGATAVGIGRPYIWGLGAFGQEGVETVLGLLRRELELVMRQAGTTSVKRITSAYVVAR